MIEDTELKKSMVDGWEFFVTVNSHHCMARRKILPT
jgi:hypothetical protein